MLPLKEESPAGTGLSDLPIFSGTRQPTQMTPASNITTGSPGLLTELEAKGVIIVPAAVAATIASGTVLSDTMPTTPPYNDDTAAAADYVSRHVAVSVPADTPTATPPNDEYMEGVVSIPDSDCSALEDESPYDALYHDSDFTDEAPAYAKPATQVGRQSAEKRQPLETELPANVRRTSAVVCADKGWDLTVENMTAEEKKHSEAADHRDHRDHLPASNKGPENSLIRDSSTIDVGTTGTANETEAHDEETANRASPLPVATPSQTSASQAATPTAQEESPSHGTPSEDSIATRRPVRMARLSKSFAQESPKPARQTPKPANNPAGAATATSPAKQDDSTAAAVPERRASKRVSLAASTATASPIAKQAATSAANKAAKPSPRSKAASTPTPSDNPSPAPRRVTRMSGLSSELLLPQPSPTATAPGKRRRRESAKDDESDLPRELRRLQDTKEFSHVDDEPIIYTVWSNGRYVPANAAGEPLVDKNAAKKARLAKAAEEAEKQRLAEEEAARLREAEEKAAAEAAKPPQKRVKKWMSSGLYAGQPMPSNPAAGLTPAERKELAKLPELSKKYPPNKTLPMPIFNGLRMLLQGRDFKMPFDVFNPLPPGQPKPVKYGRFSKSEF